MYRIVQRIWTLEIIRVRVNHSWGLQYINIGPLVYHTLIVNHKSIIHILRTRARERFYT